MNLKESAFVGTLSLLLTASTYAEAMKPKPRLNVFSTQMVKATKVSSSNKDVVKEYHFPKSGLTYDSFHRKTEESNCGEAIKRKVYDTAQEHDINPFLVLSIIEIESTCNSKVKSYVGAKGLMQIMPSAERVYRQNTGNKLQLDKYDVGYNVRVGTVYLKHLLEIYDHNVHAALVHYNAGSRPHRRAKALGVEVHSQYSHRVVQKANSFVW